MMSFNKIYQITPYYPPNLGGVQNYVKILSEYLSKNKYNVTVLTSDVGITDKSIIKIKNLHVKYIKSIEFANTPFSLQLFLELLKVPNDAIVHVHIANAFYPELVYLASKIKGFKYIAHVHIDVQASSILGKVLPLYKKLILKPTLNHAEKIICLTESFKDLMVNQYGLPKSNLVVLPNGVSNRFFLKKKIDVKKEYNLLFVGRLSLQKNIEVLLYAMSHIRSKFVLHIVGEGNQRKSLEDIIQKRELKNIILHGEKKDEELVAFYQKADIFILPSENEGMSLAMLEAMAAGIPIIASDIPQTRDFVGEGSLLIKNPNPEKYASAIDSLLKDDQMRLSMSKKNQIKAKNYSWDAIFPNIEKLYQSI